MQILEFELSASSPLRGTVGLRGPKRERLYHVEATAISPRYHAHVYVGKLRPFCHLYKAESEA